MVAGPQDRARLRQGGMSAAGAVRAGFELDAARLEAWCRAEVAGFEGPLNIGQFKGGQSNPTYLLSTPSRDYVLRRKPPGQLLKGAHDVLREARVLTALGQVDFAVPEVLGVCEDESVAGSVFYLMSKVEGRVLWDVTLEDLPREARAATFDAMNATLARLHSVDPASIGLEDYGRPNGFVQRQIARWSGQYLSDEDAGRDPNMDRVIAWLEAHAPTSEEVAIAHGDFRIDNLIFDPAKPDVAAVIDWELSTLGHPLADFAYHLMMYRMPRHLGGLAGVDLEAQGLPSEAAYIEAYCRRTGRTGIPDIDAYVVFNMFRFAAIIHGIRGRVLRGTAVSPEARTRAEQFPELAALAWKQAERAMG